MRNTNYRLVIRRLQQRIVVWVVLTVVINIVATLQGWTWIKYVAWIAAGYTCLLIIIWLVLIIQQSSKK